MPGAPPSSRRWARPAIPILTAGCAACTPPPASPPPLPTTTTMIAGEAPRPNDPYAAGRMPVIAATPPAPARWSPNDPRRGPRDVVDLGVGAAKVCALHNDGTAECFRAGVPEAEQLPWQGIRRLVLGEGPTCALLYDGTAHCDVPMPELGEVVSLSMGRDEHCAVARSGLVRCWEANHPETVRQVLVPLGAVQVDAAFSHTCAISKAGDLFCWGDNGSGQLGARTPAKSDAPVWVEDVGRVVEVATGGDHTCSRDGGGRVTCWGAGYYGQAGDGSADPIELSKKPIPGLLATRLIAAAHHSCALDASGRVVCWGWNHWKQMGEPQADVRAPAPLAGLPRATRIGGHGAVTCALIDPGRVACLGGYTPDHFGPWRFTGN